MSVSELVSTREEYMEKVKEIDTILGEAVKAIGAIAPTSPLQRPSIARPAVPITPSYDPAFGPREMPIANDQISIGTEAPIIPQRPGNSPDQSSGFTIFDAEAAARQQAEAEEQYLVDNPQVAEQAPQYDFENDDIIQEIGDIKSKISKRVNSKKSSESAGE